MLHNTVQEPWQPTGHSDTETAKAQTTFEPDHGFTKRSLLVHDCTVRDIVHYTVLYTCRCRSTGLRNVHVHRTALAWQSGTLFEARAHFLIGQPAAGFT